MKTEKDVITFFKDNLTYLNNSYPREKVINNDIYVVNTKVNTKADNCEPKFIKTLYKLNNGRLECLGFQYDDRNDKTYPNGIDRKDFDNILWEVMSTGLELF